MIRFKSRGALYGEVWFDEEPPEDRRVDVLSYRQRDAPVAGARQSPFLTIVTDLCPAPDAIAESFGKNCRYKISRADRRDGLSMELITEPRGRLREFRAFFDAFAAQRSLRPANPRWLEGACDAGQLVLATAKANGAALVWHGYVVAGDTAWLQYSASHFRHGDNAQRGMVTRANRWLHWMCMLRFRELGLSSYDWGGLFDDESTPERAGINRFKKEFGGRTVHRYEYMRPLTFRGRLRLMLHRAAELFGRIAELRRGAVPAGDRSSTATQAAAGADRRRRPVDAAACRAGTSKRKGGAVAVEATSVRGDDPVRT